MSLQSLRRLLLLLILLLGTVLRFHAIAAQPLWIDEAFSLWMARHPLPDLIDWLVRIDQHPPLYYVLLRGWIALTGESEAALRLFSALCSIATLPLVYALTRRLTGSAATALVATFLLTISPFHVRYAQEARMYALLTLLVVASAYGGWRVVSSGWQAAGSTIIASSPHRLIASTFHPVNLSSFPPSPAMRNPLSLITHYSLLILSPSAAMLTHNVTAVFLPLLLNVWVVGVWWRARSLSLRWWMGTQIGALLIWLPWAIPFWRQARGVDERFWLQPPTVDDLLAALRTINFAFLPREFPLADVWLGLAVVVALWGAWRLRRRPVSLGLLAAWLLVPVIGLLLVSLRRPLFHLPSLLWISPAWIVLLASGITAGGRWQVAGGTSPVAGALRARHSPLATRLPLVFLIGFVGLTSFSLHTYYVHTEKEAWGEAAAYVAQRAQPGDLLLFHASWVQIPFDYYFDRADLSVDEYGLPVDLFDRGELEPPMTAADLPRLRTLVQDRERVWLIYAHEWFTDPEGLIPAALDATMQRARSEEFVGIRVTLYEQRGEGSGIGDRRPVRSVDNPHSPIPDPRSL